MSQATVLLIDDDVTALSRLEDLLAGVGYAVIKANDTSHARFVFDEQPPDLILLEVGMERGEGWQLLKHVAQSTPVIVVSSHGLEEDVVRGFTEGAIDYIAKPFRSAELLARVRVRLASHVTSTETADSPPAEPEHAPPELPAVPVPPPVDMRSSSDVLPSTERRTRREIAAPVVMSYADERVLNETAPEPSGSVQDVPDDLPLGPRLHAARQRRRVTLVQAENELNIRMYYLQAIEEEKFTLLPGVALTESFLTKYATMLGQDPKRAVEEYRRLHYTVPGTPPPALGGTPTRRGIPAWTVWLLAILLAVVVSASVILAIDPTGAANVENTVRSLIGQPTVVPVR